MTAVVTTVEVDRAAPEVFASATDPTRIGEWQHGEAGRSSRSF
jgi:hypothetical protein